MFTQSCNICNLFCIWTPWYAGYSPQQGSRWKLSGGASPSDRTDETQCNIVNLLRAAQSVHCILKGSWMAPHQGESLQMGYMSLASWRQNLDDCFDSLCCMAESMIHCFWVLPDSKWNTWFLFQGSHAVPARDDNAPSAWGNLFLYPDTWQRVKHWCAWCWERWMTRTWLSPLEACHADCLSIVPPTSSDALHCCQKLSSYIKNLSYLKDTKNRTKMTSAMSSHPPYS